MARFVLLIILTITGYELKQQCGFVPPQPLINGDFANVRKNAVNCSYDLGSDDLQTYSSITFVEIFLSEEDYFEVRENETVIYGPFYGIKKPFAIVVNTVVTVNLVILNDNEWRTRFRGYIKTFNDKIDFLGSKSEDETPVCDLERHRRKRENPTCRHIILRDIFAWEKEGKLIEKATEWRLIPRDSEMKCSTVHCTGFLFKRVDNSQVDGFRWRCKGTVQRPNRKPTYCQYSQSLRKNSFFGGSHLKMWQLFGFINLWIRKVPLLVIAEQVMINPSTAVDWSSFCREVVFDAMIKCSGKIGGEGKIVEIDESKFGKRKYHKGHHVEGAWVFGAIERDTGRVFMTVVKDRRAETLIPLIEHWVEPGTKILSDQWSSYRTLNLHGYDHQTVNHRQNFKDPETGVHTNSIESSWGHAKAAVPQRGRREDFIGGYLARYIFIKHAKAKKADMMLLFLEYARRLYDPSLPPQLRLEPPIVETTRDSDVVTERD